jgi:hypothetical protein
MMEGIDHDGIMQIMTAPNGNVAIYISGPTYLRSAEMPVEVYKRLLQGYPVPLTIFERSVHQTSDEIEAAEARGDSPVQ